MKRKKPLPKLPTSNEMLQEALEEYLNNIETPIRNSGNCRLEITSSNIDVIAKLYQQLKEALVCGQGEAAWYLAQFYYNGWLVKNDTTTGDFILAIGKNLDSVKCFNTSYKNDIPLSDNLKKLSIVCARSIANSKDIYKLGINEIMKQNAAYAVKIHLKDTDLGDIFNISEPTASISTVSAPLPCINHQTAARRATQSDIKGVTRDEDKNKGYYQQSSNIRETEIKNLPSHETMTETEQTRVIGDEHDNSGCTCLMM